MKGNMHILGTEICVSDVWRNIDRRRYNVWYHKVIPTEDDRVLRTHFGYTGFMETSVFLQYFTDEYLDGVRPKVTDREGAMRHFESLVGEGTYER